MMGSTQCYMQLYHESSPNVAEIGLLWVVGFRRPSRRKTAREAPTLWCLRVLLLWSENRALTLASALIVLREGASGQIARLGALSFHSPLGRLELFRLTYVLSGLGTTLHRQMLLRLRPEGDLRSIDRYRIRWINAALARARVRRIVHIRKRRATY